MPLYEYKCEECGRTTEVLQSTGGGSTPDCEHCGSGKLRRAFSAFASRSKKSGGASSGGSSSCSTCGATTCRTCNL